ncbi:MAG: DUF998 domain-containing protein [Candidatus Thorarchaeota archaeon]|nr:MAG: DUF998 domain-containing protein [Candidatus Thorarchaeota archaeon]
MNPDYSRWTLLLSSAFFGGTAYCVLTWLSIGFYPGHISPLDNYLSVLGNSSLNPSGAIFYNLAVILAGISLIPFYVGLFQTFGEEGRNRILTLAMTIGVLNTVAIMMSGVFSEDVYDIHYLASFSIFLTWIPVLLLTNLALLNQGGFIMWTSRYGLVLGVIDTLFMFYVLLFGTDTGAIIEWVTIFSFVAWTVLLAIPSLRNYRALSVA